jgi:hypothetical protein
MFSVVVAGVGAILRRDARPLRHLLFLPGDPVAGGRLIFAAAAVVGTWLLAAVGALDRVGALAEPTRVLVVLLFFAITVALAERDPRVPRWLGWVALVLVAVQAGLLVTGMASGRVGSNVFEAAIDPHMHAGHVPRFRGFMAQPMACGSATLLVTGLLAGLRHRAVRTLATVAGLSVVIATVSFATLLVPVVAAFALPGRRAVRIVAVAFVGALAIAGLWMNPLRVQIAGHVIFDRAPMAAYARDDLGPRHMPIHTIAAPAVRIDFHFTAYALLAARSLSCLREHPLGVGGRNFVRACPVMAMNTLGQWASNRSPHNEYAALLAEGGVPTTLATIALALALVGGFRPRVDSRFRWAFVVAQLLAGFGGASLYQFAFAALLATALRARAPVEQSAQQCP